MISHRLAWGRVLTKFTLESYAIDNCDGRNNQNYDWN